MAAAVTAILVFGLTWQTVSEPSHPGSHIGLLVAAAAVLISTLPGAQRPALVYAALGLITGLLMLTKINVGLLLAAGVGGFALQHTAWPGIWRRLAWLGAIGLAGAAVGAGRPPIAPPMGAGAGRSVHLGGRGTSLACAPVRTGFQDWHRAWPAAVIAALVTLAVVCSWVLLRGTTLLALVQTVLLNPLRMPANFVVGAPWYAESLALAAVGAIVVGRAGWEIRRGRPRTRTTVWLVGALRATAFGWLLLHARTWASYDGIFHFAADCLPLLPVFLIPLAPGSADRHRLATQGVAWIAIPQVLHAYPVAGSQLAWATFLAVPLLMAGWWDLGRTLPGLVPSWGRRLAGSGGGLVVVAGSSVLGLLAYTGWTRYTESRPLDLPGAEDIRVDGITRQSLRLMSLNASIHADLLFSRQGMYSHNLWSGVPTPTTQNATHWFWLLNEGQQREIVARLEATPRTALITSQSLDQFMVDSNVPVAGPLEDFVQGHYRKLFQYGDFTFSVPRDSEAVAFGRYELKESASSDPAVFPLLFSTHVLLNGTPGRIGLEKIEYPWTPGPELLTQATRVMAEPIDPAGTRSRPGGRLGDAADAARTLPAFALFPAAARRPAVAGLRARRARRGRTTAPANPVY